MDPNSDETSYEKESQEMDNLETGQPVQQGQSPSDHAQPQSDQGGQGTPQHPQQPPKPENPLDIKDQVGKFIETATSSLFGSTDPVQAAQEEQEKAKKENEDQVKAANIRNFLDQMAADEARLRAQRQEEAQKKMMEEQEDQEEKQKEEAEKQAKDQSFEQQHILAEQSKAERKLGVGG